MELNEDFLYYGKGNISNDQNLGIFTGYGLPDPLQIQGQAMWLVFASDQSSSFGGFWLTWRTSGECFYREPHESYFFIQAAQCLDLKKKSVTVGGMSAISWVYR